MGSGDVAATRPGASIPDKDAVSFSLRGLDARTKFGFIVPNENAAIMGIGPDCAD